jgi:hypothetical protein
MKHSKDKKGITLDVEHVSAWLEHAKSILRVSKNLELKYSVVKFIEQNFLSSVH